MRLKELMEAVWRDAPINNINSPAKWLGEIHLQEYLRPGSKWREYLIKIGLLL